MNNLDILYEDNHLIVIVKPYNVPVQKDDSNDLDMLSTIKSYLKEKYNKPGNVYLGLVHRLDRPVGGIMVYAKTSKAASRLSEEIRRNNFHKTYLAVVHGKTLEKEKLTNNIKRDTKSHNSYISAEGKMSILTYERLGYNQEENLSLVKIFLETGRHHQIRVQMAGAGYPLYGDARYGLGEKVPIALFAYELEFKHPTKKEIMHFTVLPKPNNVWKLFKDNLERE